MKLIEFNNINCDWYYDSTVIENWNILYNNMWRIKVFSICWIYLLVWNVLWNYNRKIKMFNKNGNSSYGISN